MAHLTIRLSEEELEGLKAYCVKTGLSQTDVIKTYVRQLGGKVASLTPETINPLRLPSMPFWNAGELPRVKAVYFVLSYLDQVLYVGRTEDLKTRWRTHPAIDECKSFEGGVRIAWFENPRGSFSGFEKRCIDRFDPLWNKRKNWC